MFVVLWLEARIATMASTTNRQNRYDWHRCCSLLKGQVSDLPLTFTLWIFTLGMMPGTSHGTTAGTGVTSMKRALVTFALCACSSIVQAAAPIDLGSPSERPKLQSIYGETHDLTEF